MMTATSTTTTLARETTDPKADPTAPRLFTRADALAILKIGETTLFWLQRTGKLKPIRIGSRVLFNASEIRRIAAHGASLSRAEKETAKGATALAELAPRRRGRPKKTGNTTVTP
jgi:hypothetical protein